MSRSKKEKIKKSFSPFYTIVLMTAFIAVVSFLLSLIQFESQKAVIIASPFGDVPYIVEMTLTTVKNLFSVDGIKYFVSNIGENTVIFNPLITLLITIIGISIGEASGLFRRWFGKLSKLKLNVLIFITLLVSILSISFGDYMFLFLIPLFASIYKHAGRNPILGIMTAFVGMVAGYGANAFLSFNGYSLGLITEIAANLERDNSYVYNMQSTLFIGFASTALLAIFGTLTVRHFLLPNIPKRAFVIDEENKEEKGLLISNIIMLVMFLIVIYGIIPGLPMSGVLLDNGQETYLAKLMGPLSTFRQGFFYIVTTIMIIVGFIYGFINGQFKTSHDFNVGLSKGFEKLGYLFVMMFFALQMTAILEWTNIGEVVGAKMVDLLSTLQFSGLPLIVAFVLLIVILTLMVPSTITKWNLIAPIAIPLFMRSNITPDFTQFMFMTVEGMSKALTPIFIYLLIMVGFVQKYSDDENITIFGTMRRIMPTIIVMFGIWLMIIVGWYIIGLPIGINVFPTI